ncbi:DUF3604 domain-containing protein [Halioglobus maricola]|uniref:DUF3604 domain-containing protein n=1 Tax=Halioglobus maricola TaxID=2601894 RepID=A0A5P9NJA7_9GAMM|nr:DUF3604 domain-containing protein [Halioglobus maricola]QFU75659.1 DUF3604 domain-containing protein [Halioglobus maricola]
MTVRPLAISVLFSGLLFGPALSSAQPYTEQRQPCAHRDELKQPFFGDLHVHTRYSLDASTQGTRTSPAQAYEFARGASLGIQPWSDDGAPMRSLQLQRPLDFAMVSDHAELIGEVQICNNPAEQGHDSWQCLVYRNIPRAAYYLFNFMATMKQTHLGLCGDNAEICLQASLKPWQEMQDAAEANYDRSATCQFTSFVGYEWTGMEGFSGGNLHRNIVFRNADVPQLPLSFIDAPEPHLLWQGLRERCVSSEACDAIVIPHNSNLSAGYMFSGALDGGGLMTPEYAVERAQFEPLVEIMQHKGASECYYGPGSSDELCAFEQLPVDNIAGRNNLPQPDTGFVRRALADGLRLQGELGVNPYQFGVIASTDTHLGAPGAAEEDRFLGHGGAGVPAGDSIPPGLPDKLEYNPGGLAVVWAEENSRDALFNGMRARETYATSGPRIVSRLFAGQSFPKNLCEQPDKIARAYAEGVPMGSEVSGGEEAPTFLVAASQDNGVAGAPGMPLQRIQIVKGWIDKTGAAREKVFDVAGDANNGASVDIASCATKGEGFAQLCTVWHDPEFNASQPAFYYSRVLENPSCRWSQRQCVAAGVNCNEADTITEGYEGCCAAEHRPVIQERAWSSPIWFTPAKAS